MRLEQTKKHVALVVRALTCLALVGCGDDGGSMTAMDSSKPRLPGTNDDWGVRIVASGDVGLHLQMVMTSSGPLFAYYDNAPTTGEVCEEVGDAAPNKLFYGLHVAESNGPGFRTSKVDDILIVGEPPGLSLELDGSTPLLATLGGAPVTFAGIVGFCGGNDLVVYSRSGSTWSPQTAVVSSGEAATGEPASDFGEVVGYWPGIAARGDGTIAVAYKDIHAGSTQRDDTRRADLEIAIRSGGGWSAFPVDWGRGAGDFNRAAFGRDGALYVLYYIREESSGSGARGVWMARSTDLAASWETVRIASTSTLQGPDLVIDPATDTPVVAYYDTGSRLLKVTQYSGDGDFDNAASWQSETVGDTRFDEGHDPSLAFNGDGTLAVAYRRCALATANGTECDPQDDAIIFAAKSTGWDPVVVDGGEEGVGCGKYAALAFNALGEPQVGYACETVQDGVVSQEVRIAAGDAL